MKDFSKRDFSKLQVFTRGFLQDALTLMRMMKEEGFVEKDIKHYIKNPLIENPKPFGKKKLGCKGCKEKEK